MNPSIPLLLIATLISGMLQAQNIGINVNGATPAASALLDIDGAGLPANNQRGLLIPRIALTSRTTAAPVVAPAASLVVYNTATAGAVPNNVMPGFYYWNGVNQWLRMFSGDDAWSTVGNSGTTAGTNFIGTTDARDFVVKTGGSAVANERMRVLTGGQMVVNKATASAGDVFSVYANSRGGLNNGVGPFAISGYTFDGFGVYGDASNANGIGALGSNTSTTGGSVGVQGEVASRNGTGVIGLANYGSYQIPNGTSAVGVYGQVNGTLAATGQAVGVVGITDGTMTTGDATGVMGESASAFGSGVFGIATSTTTTGLPTGVYGLNNTARAAGVWGGSLNVLGTGVIGVGNGGAANTLVNGSGGAFSAANVGMYAVATNPSGGTIGAYARATSPTGTGLIAVGNNVAPTNLASGTGATLIGTSIGGFGMGTTVSQGVGLIGAGNNAATIYTPAQGAGVAGTGNRYGVMGFALMTVNTNPNNSSGSSGNNASAGGYFEVLNGGTVQTWAYVGVRDNTNTLRKIIGNGTVNTIVTDLEDNLVMLSCPEAPENLFQDYGAGQLLNGKAHIKLDPILAKNIIVNDQHPLRVFIQLEGDCNGVYVTNKTGQGFDVAELANGTSNTPFTCTVVANRADEVLPDGSISRYSAERFAAAPGPVEKEVLKTEAVDLKADQMERPPLNRQPITPARSRAK